MAQLIHSQIPEGGERDRVIAVAHGIFGRGRNWRTFARGLVEACPGWGAVLIDLREHGDSASTVETSRPHTLAAAAADVRETLAELPVVALLGHSFGGKVMLAARAEMNVKVCWMIDSSPGADATAMELDEAPVAVVALRHLESLPARFASRDAFVAALLARGLPPAASHFLATNLARAGSEFEMALDLLAIRELLTDYFAADLWAEVGRPDRGSLHIAIAGRGSSLSAADQERLEGVSRSSSHLAIHHFASAGHWIHVDDPTALLAAVSGSLNMLS